MILTTFELDEYVFEALRHGASGFLVKDTEPVELIAAVRAVARGDALAVPQRHATAHRRVRHALEGAAAVDARWTSSPSASARSSR